jgi:hypothetical protein
MKEGKEPLRSFGDLMQFYTMQAPEPPKGAKDAGKNKGPGATGQGRGANDAKTAPEASAPSSPVPPSADPAAEQTPDRPAASLPVDGQATANAQGAEPREQSPEPQDNIEVAPQPSEGVEGQPQ